MALTWQETICLQVLCLVISASCSQGHSRAEGFSLNRLASGRLPKPVRSLQEMADPRGKEDPGHQVHRVRRSWLADYMDDLWTHIRLSFPRGAIYAFPVAIGVILLLCCATAMFVNSYWWNCYIWGGQTPKMQLDPCGLREPEELRETIAALLLSEKNRLEGTTLTSVGRARKTPE
ncbi:UNVERIFIED_CONTAM: hypothetical protein K2H54_043537 [Gekko kuhli]